jgi:hypothetical protein
MDMFVNKSVFYLLSLLFLTVAGCVQAPMGVSYPEPEWVRLGSGAYHSDQGPAFYGVATASGLKNQVLLRATADNLAREELFKVLDAYAGLLAGGTGPADDSMQPLIQMSMQDAAIADHWFDERSGSMYALCRSNLNTFKEALARYNYFEMSRRNALLESADSVHARMAAQK